MVQALSHPLSLWERDSQAIGLCRLIAREP